MWQRLKRKISFLDYLFVYFFAFFAIRISRFFLLLFLLSAFFPSASAIRSCPVRVLQTPYIMFLRMAPPFFLFLSEHKHFTFTHRFFPAEAIENHGSRVTENLSKSSLQRPNLRQKVQKKVSFFQTLVLNKVKRAQIALNAHVHLRTANQQMSRPERQVSTCFHISNRPLPFHLHLHEISKVSRLRDLVSALPSP